MKPLSEMSLEELWQLFPIFLTPHQDCWAEWYREEAAFLEELLKGFSPRRISHIGSTAVPEIWAKPILDILVELPSKADLAEASALLTAEGYICMSQNEERISLNKGYTPAGYAQKVFHLHLRRWGDNPELYFRDYLREHPDCAAAYQRLKLGLWPQFEHDRDGYTAAKSDFVAECTRKARALYPDRYK